MNLLTRQQGINVGEDLDISLIASTDVDLYTCETMQYLCILVNSSAGATFKDVNLNNNLFCENVNDHKQCAPAVLIKVSIADLSVTNIFVRGYVTNMNITVNVTNIDSTFDIVPLSVDRLNYNLTFFYSDVYVSDGAAASFSADQTYSLNNDSLLYSGLHMGDDMTFNGKE